MVGNTPFIFAHKDFLIFFRFFLIPNIFLHSWFISSRNIFTYQYLRPFIFFSIFECDNYIAIFLLHFKNFIHFFWIFFAVELDTFLSLEISLQQVGSKCSRYLIVLEMFKHLSYFDPHNVYLVFL